MGEVVSLRQVRKTKDRDRKQLQASENRAVYGLSKAEKALALAERDAARRRLEQHRREDERP
ncbi:DUF4169 family protein [Algihabitans albus]|uniref:DUF4169 family protein n=1 Tax=Algihabitans albus TaxID=2164067 RepID=UPI000E5D21BC|nr:DUF4169 family protein [Algihabitans albus]